MGIRAFMQGMEFEWEGEIFDLSPDLISMLHHWNFGTSRDWYRSKNKSIILPARGGKLVKVTDVEAMLDAALERYNELAQAEYVKCQPALANTPSG